MHFPKSQNTDLNNHIKKYKKIAAHNQTLLDRGRDELQCAAVSLLLWHSVIQMVDGIWFLSKLLEKKKSQGIVIIKCYYNTLHTLLRSGEFV